MLISEELKKALAYAGDEALRTGWTAVLPEHLLLGLVRTSYGSAVRALLFCGADPVQIRKSMDRVIFKEEALPFSSRAEVRLAAECEPVLRDAAMLAFRDGVREAKGLHLLLALLSSSGNRCREVLAGAGVSRVKLEEFSAEERTPESVEKGSEAGIDSGCGTDPGNGSGNGTEDAGDCSGAGEGPSRVSSYRTAERGHQAELSPEEIAAALTEQIERCRAFLLSGRSKFPS